MAIKVRHNFFYFFKKKKELFFPKKITKKKETLQGALPAKNNTFDLKLSISSLQYLIFPKFDSFRVILGRIMYK